MNQQVQQGQQPPQQAGGFSTWKMILIFIATNTLMSQLNRTPSAPASVFRNVIQSGSEFELSVVCNSSDWTWTENLIYSTSTVVEKNITFTGQELLDKLPALFISIKGEGYQIQEQLSLVSYLKIKKDIKKNLLFDSNEEYMIKPKDDEQNTTFGWHVKNRNYILLIHDTNDYPINTVPPQLKSQYEFFHTDLPQYKPALDTAGYSLRRKDHLIINETETYEIPIEFSCYWVWKYMLLDGIKNSGKTYEQFGIENVFDETSEDQIKEMIFETNIYFLCLTICVSLLHTVFSTLAIKNDYQYWKNLDSQEGISVRTLYTNFAIDIVITLYLMDNETSFLIIIQQFAELALGVWKILKTTAFSRKETFPYFKLENKSSYISTTQQHDEQAAKYLYYALIPLFGCYLIYAIVYQEHKGFYSFILESLVGFIYIFGFINMTPQLYINYKLKSVAHLPWRTMIYKFLNTIIDDLFAFIITMPWLKRLSCFRDDIIFLIYIYQRRIYRVDPKRQVQFIIIQEHGVAKEESQEAAQEIKQESSQIKQSASDDKKKKVE